MAKETWAVLGVGLVIGVVVGGQLADLKANLDGPASVKALKTQLAQEEHSLISYYNECMRLRREARGVPAGAPDKTVSKGRTHKSLMASNQVFTSKLIQSMAVPTHMAPRIARRLPPVVPVAD